MHKIILISLTLLFFCSCFCFSDVIHLKSGRKIHTKSTQIVGEKVLFTVYGGQMSVDVRAVAKIVKGSSSRDPLASRKEKTYEIKRRSYGQTNSRRTSRGRIRENSNSYNARDVRDLERINEFIANRRHLLTSLVSVKNEIASLRKRIAKKDLWNQSASADRKILEDAEREFRLIQASINEIPNEARRQGFAPYQIRLIEDRLINNPYLASLKSNNSIDKNDKFRNANVKMTDGDPNNPDRYTDIALEEYRIYRGPDYYEDGRYADDDPDKPSPWVGEKSP